MRFGAGAGARRLLTAALTVINVAGTIPLVWFACSLSPWYWLAAGAWVAVGVFAALWYPRRFVKALHGTLDDRAVTVHTGVWWRREIRMPLPQLRTFECWTLPFRMWLDCSVVVLRFAGGAVWLPLLPQEQARELTRRLSEGSL